MLQLVNWENASNINQEVGANCLFTFDASSLHDLDISDTLFSSSAKIGASLLEELTEMMEWFTLKEIRTLEEYQHTLV